MLLLGYILVTCLKNNIVTLHVTFMLYRRNKMCLLGNLIKKADKNEAKKKKAVNFDVAGEVGEC